MHMRSFHVPLKWLPNTMSPGVAAVSQHLMAVSSEVEDLGEDALESSSRTSTGSAEPESLLSQLTALFDTSIIA